MNSGADTMPSSAGAAVKRVEALAGFAAQLACGDQFFEPAAAGESLGPGGRQGAADVEANLIQQAQQGATVADFARKLLELEGGQASCVERADVGSRTGSVDRADGNAGLFEPFDDADMGKSAGAATRECQADAQNSIGRIAGSSALRIQPVRRGSRVGCMGPPFLRVLTRFGPLLFKMRRLH